MEEVKEVDKMKAKRKRKCPDCGAGIWYSKWTPYYGHCDNLRCRVSFLSDGTKVYRSDSIGERKRAKI